MTHSYVGHVWHDSSVCGTWLVWCDSCNTGIKIYDTYTETWYMCDMTHLYVGYNWLVCGRWLVSYNWCYTHIKQDILHICVVCLVSHTYCDVLCVLLRLGTCVAHIRVVCFAKNYVSLRLGLSKTTRRCRMSYYDLVRVLHAYANMNESCDSYTYMNKSCNTYTNINWVMQHVHQARHTTYMTRRCLCIAGRTYQHG